MNHVVQGTGSYIFKQSIIKTHMLEGVEILIPIHDALLLQTEIGYDHTKIVATFQSTMTELLEGKINAKASIANFFA